MRTIFHTLPKKEADRAKSDGLYRPASLADDGFIHCSYLHQVCQVANFLYEGQSELVLLEIDKLLVDCDVVDEDLYESGELFPHIYGPLPWRAVVAAHAFPRSDDGTFRLPTSVSV